MKKRRFLNANLCYIAAKKHRFIHCYSPFMRIAREDTPKSARITLIMELYPISTYPAWQCRQPLLEEYVDLKMELVTYETVMNLPMITRRRYQPLTPDKLLEKLLQFNLTRIDVSIAEDLPRWPGTHQAHKWNFPIAFALLWNIFFMCYICRRIRHYEKGTT